MCDSQVHFEVGNKVIRTGPSLRDIKCGEVYTIRSVDWCLEELDFEGVETFGYNMNRFKLVEENMNKQFTKDDLVAGKHVVRYTDDGELGLVLESTQGKFILFHESDTFASPLEDADYNEVFEIYSPEGRNDLEGSLRLIWQREEKSQSQIELEKLQKQISKLQDQAKRLEKSL